MTSTQNLVLTTIIVCVVLEILLNALLQNVIAGPPIATHMLSAVMIVSAVAYGVLGPYPITAVPIVRLTTIILLTGVIYFLSAMYMMMLRFDPQVAYRIGGLIAMAVVIYNSKKST